MYEVKERLSREALEKRGAEACKKYEEMFNQTVPVLMPDGYPTNNNKYLKAVEKCIKRGTPLTGGDFEEIFHREKGALY